MPNVRPPPESFDAVLACGDEVRTAAEWILLHSPTLFCNTNAMLVFFKHLGITEPVIWNPDERHQAMCFVDAVVAHVYGLSRDDYAYILTRFPILRQQETGKYGEFRSERLCLEWFDRMQVER